MNTLEWLIHPWRLMAYMDEFLNKMVKRLEHQDEVILNLKKEIREHAVTIHTQVRLIRELIPELQAKINPPEAG